MISSYQPTRYLSVYRTLLTGEKVLLGELAQSSQGCFFAYHPAYLEQYPNISPFKLSASTEPQQAPAMPHFNLHGVFADALPDGWGMLLQDRYFASQGINYRMVSMLDRLAFVGNRGIGALSFEPSFDHGFGTEIAHTTMAELGNHAERLFDGLTEEILMALVQAGSSGGARPKSQVYLSQDAKSCRTIPQLGDEAWIVKFTSQNLSLSHDEGVCEAVYLMMAEQADLQPVQWRLFETNTRRWLGVQRFDYQPQTMGRIHTHSLCGLLDASHRMPSMDYFELIKATKLLCKDRQATQLQFRRAIFNLFAINQDDHTKNWAFLQDEQGQWMPSPAYDITYSPMHHKEHSMAFGRYGKAPSLDVIQSLADLAGFGTWQEAKAAIEQVVGSVSDFRHHAKQLGVRADTITMIAKHLDEIYQQNKGLLV